MFASRRYSALPVFLLLLAIVDPSPAQQLKLPEESQAASVSQTIGLTQITIMYHSPRVKGRKIWGALVPYNEVWRAGANENTTISFTDDVKVEGRELPAGSYGLHMIPTAGQWTVIFSKNATSWGSFFYRQDEDALRVTVTPREMEFQEWLSYRFADLEPESVSAELRWEKLAVTLRITLDVTAIVLEHIRLDLRTLAGFSWQAFNQAAAYCAEHDVNLEEGMKWADRSIAMNQNFTNLNVKADLLEKTGKKQEAVELRKNALKRANEVEVNAYGYRLLGTGRVREAIEAFKFNVDKYPNSWNVYDSLGEAYERNGDTRLAIEYYNKALDRATDATQRKRITDTVKNLQSRLKTGK